MVLTNSKSCLLLFYLNTCVTLLLGFQLPSPNVKSFTSSSSSHSSLSEFQSYFQTCRTRSRLYMHSQANVRDNLCLKASSSDDDDDGAEAVEAEIVIDNSTPKLQLKHREQVSSYRTSSILYMALALDSWKRRNAVSIFGVGGAAANTINIVSPVSLSAGFVLAAVASRCLISAAENNRLASDTYKRMNLALSLFSLMNLMSHLVSWPFLGGAACFCSLFNTRVALKGWVKGVKGLGSDESRKLYLNSYISELSYGLKTNLKGVITFKSKESIGYFLSFTLVSIIVLHNFLVVPLLWKKNLPRVNALRIASTARLLLAESILFTLMDAANRKRLSGSTFIKLTLGLSATSLAGKDRMN